MEVQYKKIEDILYDYGIVSKSILKSALERYKSKGTDIVQYLIAYKHLDEVDFTKCMSEMCRFPYLPLSVYNVSEEAINLIPYNIALRYGLLPIDKIGGVLMVVMFNPLDVEAIEELEKITGCKILPFVDVLSEIRKAISIHYHLDDEKTTARLSSRSPFLIEAESYRGLERRRAARISVKMRAKFAFKKYFRTGIIKNFSLSGFLFESKHDLPISSCSIFHINLPQRFSPIPIAIVARVVRVSPMDKGKYQIGVSIVRMQEEDASTMFAFARSQKK